MHSGHNASGYFTVYGDEALQSDHFSSRLSFGDTQTVWARTGYLGFLRRTELTDACGGEDAKETAPSRPDEMSRSPGIRTRLLETWLWAGSWRNYFFRRRRSTGG